MWWFVAYARASSIKVETDRDMKGTHLKFYVKTCFPLLYSQSTCQTIYILSCTMKTTSYSKSNWNIPNHCTTWTLGNFSCTWIVFHQSNSTLPHWISLCRALSFSCKQPAFYYVFERRCPTPLKKIHMELNATDIKFSTQFSRVWLFLWI